MGFYLFFNGGGSLEKCAIFIDGGYIDALLRRWGNFQLDYFKFSGKILEIVKADILRIYYYNCLPIVREMYDVKCPNCNNNFKVHFRSNEDKLVICNDCLRKNRQKEIRIYNYTDELTNNDKKYRDSKEKFYNKLKLLPRFEVKFGELQLINGDFKQKGVDVLMSLDIVSKCFDKQIQHAIIIAGDSDFIPAIHKAKECGAVVHLFCNKNKVNNKLLFEVDEIYDLNYNFFESLKMDINKAS